MRYLVSISLVTMLLLFISFSGDKKKATLVTDNNRTYLQLKQLNSELEEKLQTAELNLQKIKEKHYANAEVNPVISSLPLDIELAEAHVNELTELWQLSRTRLDAIKFQANTNTAATK